VGDVGGGRGAFSLKIRKRMGKEKLFLKNAESRHVPSIIKENNRRGEKGICLQETSQ